MVLFLLSNVSRRTKAKETENKQYQVVGLFVIKTVPNAGNEQGPFRC